MCYFECVTGIAALTISFIFEGNGMVKQRNNIVEVILVQ